MKVLSLFAVLLLLAAPAAVAQQLGHTASRANHFNSPDLPDSPAVKWKFRTMGKVVSSPVIHKNILLTGSADSCMYALDKHSGRQLWKFRSGGEITSSVACDSTALYFLSTDGYLYALEIQSGRVLWKFRTRGERRTDAWDYFLSSPTVHKRVVYVGSSDSSIYAVDARNGRLQWEYRTGGPVHASPVVADNMVLAGSYDGYFYALGTDGSLRWKFDTMGGRYFPTGEVQFHAVTIDSTVYFCSRDFNLYALHLRTGKGLWVYHEPGSWTSVPALSGEQLLVSTSDTHRALSFDENGILQWKSEVRLNAFGAIASTGHYGYMGSLDGRMHKINLRTGHTVTIFTTLASRLQGPRFFDSATGALHRDLMARYNNDFIRMYGDFLDMGSILSSPWLDNGVLYFGSTDGFIYALE
ncbi:PQQ-binding-like beta-propeller repeat protein [Chitinophaga solisilvae]|uniref:outer membrane protein assembly factor BamB family protein n=1 Tax=Chitinophaga solisilvae TaxID=1233460 RepID=UPI00136B8F0E|nr:PQQ-binding-like beta-propeller repeat protein [Chitinophaga solisilvae]